MPSTVKIKMLKYCPSSEGNFSPGMIIDAAEKFAKILVAGGYAVYVVAPVPVAETIETTQADNPPENKMRIFKKRGKKR